MTRRLQTFFSGALIALATLVMAFGSTPLTPRLAAQATINSTTLSAAVTAGAGTLTVASASTVAAGQYLFVDAEIMQITAVSSTTLTVTRGLNGTRASRHASGAQAWTGPANYFSQSEPKAGPCTTTDEVALPRIVAITGAIFQCTDSIWVKYSDGGFNEYSAGGTTTYTSAGAITIKPGVSLVGSAGALAMTLAAPSVQQNGMTMAIFASTAQAHTITNTAGFNGGTTARDVCTLGGAIGDGILIQAWGGVWYVLANRNCTLA